MNYLFIIEFINDNVFASLINMSLLFFNKIFYFRIKFNLNTINYIFIRDRLLIVKIEIITNFIINILKFIIIETIIIKEIITN